MSPSSKMGQEMKFQQRWEFRRKENDLDSSSNDSKSSSNGEPVFKKHKLVSTLISPENDETSDAPNFQQKGEDDPGTGCHPKSRKAKKMENGSNKKGNIVNNKVEGDSSKKVTRKKRKSSSTYDPASLNDIKIFMESLLEELKVTRENLSVWMREEMLKLVAFDATLQTRRREGCDRHGIVPVQHQSNFEPSMNLMTGDAIQQPTRKEGSYGQEVIQVQRQNNLESGMKDDATPLPPRRGASSAEEINEVQHQNKIESGMRLMKDDTNRQPSRQGGNSAEEIIQMQHQNNFESGMRLMKDDTTLQQKRKGGCYRQEIIQVQSQNNFEASLSLIKDDATQQPTRKEGSYGQGIIQMQHQNNFKSGVRLMKDDTSQQPTRRESTYNQEIIQGQHLKNFEAGMNMTKDDTRQPRRREGSFGREIIQVQHQNKFESSVKTQKCNGGSLGSPAKSQQTAVSNNCYQVFEDQVECGQGTGLLMSIEKDKVERLGLSFKPKFSFDSSNQVASSMYLTLPTVLPESRVENYRIDSSSCNYIQPGVSGMRKGVNAGRTNLLLDSSTPHGCFSGQQQVEQLPSITQVGSRSVGCLDQNSTPISTFGAGFPVPLHRGMDGSFSIPSQVSMRNLPRENNHILGLRMNGGAMKFSGGSSLSGHYVPNNLHNHLSFKTDGRLMAVRSPEFKDGH